MTKKDDLLQVRVPKALRQRLRKVAKLTAKDPEREGLGPESESDVLRRAIALGLSEIERRLQ